MSEHSEDQDVDEQGKQSFPASDPPSLTPEPDDEREGQDDEELERESQTQGDIA